MRIFVLLFNARTENEGIHTIRIGDRDKVLMFEAEDDATRYALLLEAQDFPSPSVEEMDSEEIEQFCRSAGYDWEIVTKDKLEVPPEQNIPETDWQKDPENNPSGDLEDTERSSQKPSLSEEELEQLRRRFEGLL